MKLSTREDIEAPLNFVFSVLSDAEAWERAALRRGADVQRTDKLRSVGVGASWLIGFDFRGKKRQLAVRLSALESDAHLGFDGEAANMEGDLVIDLVPLSAKRTRIVVATEIKPRTLGARLILQSLKLAKGKVAKRFETRVGQMCNDIETRFRGPGRR